MLALRPTRSSRAGLGARFPFGRHGRRDGSQHFTVLITAAAFDWDGEEVAA